MRTLHLVLPIHLMQVVKTCVERESHDLVAAICYHSSSVARHQNGVEKAFL